MSNHQLQNGMYCVPEDKNECKIILQEGRKLIALNGITDDVLVRGYHWPFAERVVSFNGHESQVNQLWRFNFRCGIGEALVIDDGYHCMPSAINDDKLLEYPTFVVMPKPPKQ